MNYYNEIDPYAAQWIRNLIAAGHIPAGVVDERSIEDVTPADLAGYTQCHFFAGIAGWSLALRLAGVPDDYPIWTGSCPCQPFSAAGEGAGFDDPRHLWPAFHWLIAHCNPSIVVGEQVASKAADAWIDLVHADMEALGYAFGCVPFPAAGIGAPHIRDRNYWLGHTDHARLEGLGRGHQAEGGWIVAAGSTAEAGELVRLANAPGIRLDEQRRGEGTAIQGQCAERGGEQARSECAGQLQGRLEGLGGAGGLANAAIGAGQSSESWAGVGGLPTRDGGCEGRGAAGPTNGHWRVADWLGCRDGKWRPVEPGTFPLAHGVSGRVGRLRAYGNAIVPQAAAEFLIASLS